VEGDNIKDDYLKYIPSIDTKNILDPKPMYIDDLGYMPIVIAYGEDVEIAEGIKQKPILWI
jgi:hypothetical protein